MNGDGRIDLVRIDAAGIGVRHLGADGLFAETTTTLPWPARHLAWDLTDLEGDGTFEVLMLVEGREVRLWREEVAGEFWEGERLVEARCYMPRGVSNMDFARDIDGDGREDLVLPGAGEYLIHLRRSDGGWEEPLRVAFEANIRHEVGDPDDLTSSFGQDVDIPWFRVEDVDGDGLRDLVSETTDRVDFHIAAPAISDEPTWSLDLAVLRALQPGEEDFDLADVFAAVGRMVSWRVMDLDGVAPHDLVLRLGATTKIYRGAARAGPGRTPDQILKASGTVIWFFLRDVQGDSLPELQLLRVEKLGLARILRWLVLPGSLDFDLFTYQNEGGTFSRRPTRRNGIALGIPRLLSIGEDMEEFGEEFERQQQIPARAVDFDGDGVENDVVDVVRGELRLYRDRIPPDLETAPDLRRAELGDYIEKLLLEDLDRLEDGAVKTIDLGSLDEWRFSPGADLRDLCRDVTADLTWPGATPQAELQVHVRDLDGDGRLDFVLLATLEDGAMVLQLLVRT